MFDQILGKKIILFTQKLVSEANPTKLFFFVNEDFFRFLLLSLAVAQYTHFFSHATNFQA